MAESKTAATEKEAALAEDVQSAAALKAALTEYRAGKPASEPAKEAKTDAEPEGKGEEVKTAVVTEPVTAEKSTLTDKQKAAAKHLGIEDDELAAMTPAELRRMERESARTRRMEQQYGQLQQELKATTAGKPKADGADDEGAGDEIAASESEEPDDWEPISADEDVDTMVGRLNKRLANLHARLGKYEEAESQRTTQQQERTANKFFDGLDGRAYPQYGKGVVHPDSPEQAARTECRKRAEIEKQWHIQHGDDFTDEQCLSEALAFLHRKQDTKPDKQKPTVTARAGASARLPEDSEQDEGLRNLRAALDERGYKKGS